MAQTPLATSPFHFTGEIRDWNAWQYHRARYYAPDLGVWMSLDPLETRNRYAYVNGNPINFVDRTGLLPCETAVTACGVAVGSPFDLIFGDIAACSVAIGCMGAAALGAYLAGQAAANMDVPDLSFSLPNSSQGSGDLSDAERLALAAICGAAICEADLQTLLATITATLTITWIPVPTAPATATVMMQDHRNFQPTGTPDPRPTQQPIPVRTPDPTATATATPDAPKHITLGFENTRGHTTLSNFTRILRRHLGTPHVYWFEQWQDARLTHVDASIRSTFELAFLEATTNATQIHFNLDGFPRSADESGAAAITFVRQHGNGGVFPRTEISGIYVSAVELFRIVSDGQCYKTKFYRNAYMEIPDNLREVPIEGNAICNAGFSR